MRGAPAGVAEAPGPLGRSMAPRDWRPRSLLDVAFMLVPATAAIGSTVGLIFIGGVAFYPFKVLVAVIFMVTVAAHRRSPSAAIPVLMVSACLAAWALLSTLWSPAGAEGVKEATIFLFLCMLLVSATRAIGTTWFLSFIAGWPIAILVTGIVSSWELATGAHLSSEYIRQEGVPLDGLILSTFDNPNNYGAFLTLALALTGVMLTMDQFPQRYRRLAAVGLVVGVVLLPFTASRLALIGLVFGLGTFIVLTLPTRPGQRLLLLAWSAFLPVVALASRLSPGLADKLANIADRGGEGPNSGTVRFALVRNGVDYFVQSRGLGVGAAGYEALIVAGDFDHAVEAISNPHNFWIEILSQYGIVGIAAVGFMLAVALHSARPLTRPSYFGAAMIATFVSYFFAAMTASSYVNEPVSWTFFATFVSLGVWAVTLRSSTPLGHFAVT